MIEHIETGSLYIHTELPECSRRPVFSNEGLDGV